MNEQTDFKNNILYKYFLDIKLNFFILSRFTIISNKIYSEYNLLPELKNSNFVYVFLYI